MSDLPAGFVLDELPEGFVLDADPAPAPAPRRGGSPGARMVERIPGYDLEMPEIQLPEPTPLGDLRAPTPRPERIDTVTFRDGGSVRMPVAPDFNVQPLPDALEEDPATYTQAQPRDYASLTTGQRAGEQWRSGVETLRQGLSSMGLGGLYDELDRLQRFDAGSMSEQELARAPVPLGAMTPEQRAAYRARIEESAGRRLALIVASQGRQALLASNPQARAMVEALNAGRWGDGWRAFASDPAGIIQQFAVESAPTSLAMLGAGVTGGVLGGPAIGAASAYLSSAGLDFGPRTVEILMDALKARGVNITDERAVAAYLRTDPDIGRAAARQAGYGAGAMAAFDAAGLGAAGGIRRGASVAANAGRVTRNTGVQLVEEPLGELAAQLASTGEVKPGDLAAELLGAGPQVVGTTAYGTIMEARNPTAPERPVTAPAPLPGEAFGPPAPSRMGPLGQIVAAPSMPQYGPPAPPASPPPQPAAASSPAAPAAQPPAGAPAASAGVPPPAAVAAPPGAPNDWGAPPEARFSPGETWSKPGAHPYQILAVSPDGRTARATDGGEDQFTISLDAEWLNGWRPEQQPAAPGAAAVPPAAPPAGPPGSSVGAPAVVPPAPPPPTPNTGRAELEALLNQPSPAAQAAQAAQRAERLQALTAGLPPGWRVADEGGVLSVLDPNGDWHAQFEAPPADPASLLSEVAGVHQQGVRQGLYPNAADAAAQQTNAAPSPAQAQAGNYAKGKVKLHGLDISIETPRGAERTGVDRGGKPWSVTMPAHYGYVRGTTGADGDQVDVYLGPRAEDESAPVFVMDQVDADTGRFDEHKAIIGVGSEEEARALYAGGFSDGRAGERLAGVTRMSLPEFKEWLASGRTTGPLNREAVAEGLKRRRAEKARQRQAEATDDAMIRAANAERAPVQVAPDDSARLASDLANNPMRAADEREAAAEASSLEKLGETLASDLAENPYAEPPPSPGPKRKARPPQSLLEFLASRGGLHDRGGDVLHIFSGKNPVVPGRGRLIRKTGMALDRALEIAREADYFGRDEQDTNVLLNALSEEARGRRQRTITDVAEGALERRDANADAEREAIDRAVADVESVADQHRIPATAAEIRQAAETAISEDIDPLDALIEVIERAAQTAAVADERLAADGTEWEIPWDAAEATAPQPGGPEAPGAATAPERQSATGPDAEQAAGESSLGDRTRKDDGGPEDDTAAERATERVETLDGPRDQFLIPGVAPVSDRERLAAQAERRLRGGDAPPPEGGLFDPGATQQPDLVEAARNVSQQARPARATKGQAAVETMLQERAGSFSGAFQHPVLGPIDLIWGKPGKGGSGLAHIEELHPEVLPRLASIIEGGMVLPTSTAGRARLALENDRAVVALNRAGADRRWVLTAYDTSVPPAEAEARRAAAFGRAATSSEADTIPSPPGPDDVGGPGVPDNDAGGVPLYSSPFDPDLFMRLIGKPAWQAILKAGTALSRVNGDLARRFWRGETVPDGVTIQEKAATQDVSALFSRFRLPRRMFASSPSLAAIVEQGIEAERNMARWNKRLNDEFAGILGRLRRAKGDVGKVTHALLDADEQGLRIEDAAIAARHFEDHGLSPAEAAAAASINRLLVKVARMVDMHRRAMMPKVQAEKRRIWAAMSRILDSGSVPGAEYARLYRRRAYLGGRIKAGLGDLKAHAAEVEAINTRLGEMRAADPALQAKLDTLRGLYDEAEARLAATSVRTRDGYFPHKFFGSWRLFEIGETDPETGEPTRTELTSDQGFYTTRDDAIRAAAAYLKENPGANLHIEPKVTAFGGEGSIVSQKAWLKMRRSLEEGAGLSAEDAMAAMKGVVTTASKRRRFAPAMYRKGAEGFSKDMDRVIRTHLAQGTRYVEMDKLKWSYVTTMERLGLSPVPTGKALDPSDPRAELQRAMQAWWRDVNGAPQPGEQMLDRIWTAFGVPAAATIAGLGTAAMATAGVAATTGGAMLSLPVAAALAGYTGLRMARALKKSPDFPTRQVMQDISGDMANLKLGMVLNLGSAVVNLSQTFINTYPVLGERWTAAGMKRALPALWSLARNAGEPGRMSTDAILLERAGVRSTFSIAADNPAADVENRTIGDRIRYVSMLAFSTAEQMNRSVAFLGALARAEAAGKAPGPAFQEAIAVLGRTQFEGGVATRPEVLRSHALKLPAQFKNFMAQQIGFVLGLRGPGEIGRFLAALTLTAGLLGFVALPLLLGITDWFLEALDITDEGLLNQIRDFVLRSGAEGSMAGTAADVMARGLPALLGVDISSRVGMGVGFVPDSGSDFSGPFLGTVGQLNTLQQQQARLTDYLNALAPGVGNPLRVMEAAANGASITSEAFWSGGLFGDGEAVMRQPTKRGQEAYEPTDGELALQATGLRPLRAALLQDARQVNREEVEDRRRKVNAYLARIIEADRNMPRADLDTPEANAIRERQTARIREIILEARQKGVGLTNRQIQEARQNARLSQAERDMRQAPKALRPGMAERQRGIEGRFQPQP